MDMKALVKWWRNNYNSVHDRMIRFPREVNCWSSVNWQRAVFTTRQQRRRYDDCKSPLWSMDSYFARKHRVPMPISLPTWNF